MEIIKHKVYSEKKKENEIFISRKRKNPEKFYADRGFELFNNKNYEEIFNSYSYNIIHNKIIFHFKKNF